VMSRVWGSPWIILFLVMLVVVLLDQLTKYVATDALGPGGDRGPVDIVPSLLQLRYVENTGAAFGIFQDSTTVLLFVSVGVIAVLALVFWGMISRSRLLGLAFGLQFGGAFGNLIDRARLGYVVDFIDVPYWPTFNVADSGITVGVVILAFVLLVKPQWAAEQEPDTPESREGKPHPRFDVADETRRIPSPSQDADR
jgi:signal peptidase II